MHKYDPRKKPHDELERTLACGENILSELIDGLNSQEKKLTDQSWIITGSRGAGKSHLLTLLYRKIYNDKGLSEHWLPLIFPEELFNVDSLYRMLLIIFENLFNDKNCAQDLSEIKKKYDKIKRIRVAGSKKDKIDIKHNNSKSLFDLLIEVNNLIGKKIILMMENLQDLIGELLSENDQKHLRAFMHENPDVFIIIGTALSVFPDLQDYGKPFYHFFRFRSLESLDNEGIINFIQKIASYKGKNVFSKIDKNRPYIYTYRLLTGGNPRLIIFLYELLVDYEILSTEIILSKITELTPYFLDKTKMESQQKRMVLDCLAMGTPAQTATEIADEINEDAKSINEQLKRLESEGWIRVISIHGKDVKKKEVFYTLRDYFYRIWYKVRTGGIDAEDIQCLAELIVLILDKPEIEKRLHIYKKTKPETYMLYQKARELVDDQSYMKNINVLFENSKHEISEEIKRILDEGKKYYEEENWEKVLLEGKRLLRYEAGKSFGYIIIGIYHAKKSDYDNAIQSYSKAIEIDPDEYYAWINLGGCYFQKGDHDNAIQSYTKAIEIDPDEDLTWFNLGNSYAKKGDYDNAIQSYTKAIEIDPDKELTWFNLGNSYAKKEDYDNAIETYTKAIEIEPANYSAWLNLGNSYNEKGDYDNAIRSYTQALELKPDRDSAWSNIGNSYIEKEEYNNAIQSYTQALELKPNEDSIWFNLGYGNYKINDYINSYQSYSNYIQFTEDFKQIIDRLKIIVESIFNSTEELHCLLDKKTSHEEKIESICRLLLRGKFIAITDSLDILLNEEKLPVIEMNKLEYFLKAYILDLLASKPDNPEIKVFLKYWVSIITKMKDIDSAGKTFLKFIHYYLKNTEKEMISLELINELVQELCDEGIEISDTIVTIVEAIKDPNTRKAQTWMADPLFSEIVKKLS